jgi:CubicO group peptidase (beta-lactamase class C family)
VFSDSREAERKFDYDKPVAHYWPDFALAGKGEITCRQLLEHRAGLYAVEKPLQLSDFGDNYPAYTML